PRYIETIAKTGYRLLATTAWLDEAVGDEAMQPASDPSAAMDSSGPEPAPASPASRRRLPASAFAAAAILLTPAAATLWTLAAGDAASGAAVAEVPAALDLGYRAITSTPGQERLPALSPDGSTVAFAQAGANGDSVLMLQPVAQAAARALTQPGA